MYRTVALLSSLLAVARGQQVGTNTAETHPALSLQKCTKAGGCTTQQASVVLDSNWRWLHNVGGSTNCYTGNTWDATLCPDPKTCATNCALDGADYSGTYGITSSGTALTMKFVTNGPYSKNIGSRVYLMAPGSDSKYEMFKLKNMEFAFDVDVSNLPCGLNGALYFAQMDADGGVAKYPTNKAGAKYGTGYCDAQCPHDIKFINGEANVQGWTPSSNDVNAGKGTYGTCCTEMDIWEANQFATAYTPHPCTTSGQYRCSGTTCGDGSNRYGGVCDKDGCDFNSYRMGNTSFIGPGKMVDTKQKFTVVTQFITDTGTAAGKLTEIRRLYVQNGKVYTNSNSNVAGVAGNSLSDAFCKAQKTAFGDTNDFATKGGMTKMGTQLDAGMVLVMSIWDDHDVNMLWLDSSYPPTKSPSAPGVTRGPCSPSSGVPADVEAQSPNASVVYGNIKIGEIGSTYTGGTVVTPPSSTTSKAATTSAASGGGTVAKYGQCGGINYTGPKGCVAGTTCTVINDYYYQCL